MRIRTIKPEFFTHAGLYDAEKESGFPLRIAFAGLWCACDREGRFKWEPRRLGVMILPYDNVDFSRVLDVLVTRAFVVKYRVGTEWFGYIPSFKTHQVINPRESKSNIPQVSDAEELADASARVVSRVGTRDVLARGEGKGKEGNKEGNTTRESRVDGVQDSDFDFLPKELDTPEFRKAWAEWLKYLRSKRKAPAQLTKEKQLQTLQGYGPAGAIASINQSITNGWQGLFEPKQSSAEARKEAAKSREYQLSPEELPQVADLDAYMAEHPESFKKP